MLCDNVNDKRGVVAFHFRESIQNSNAMWHIARMLPMCDGPMTTAFWWQLVGVTRASWSGPTSQRACGNSNCATARSQISRAKMTEARNCLLFRFQTVRLCFWYFKDANCIIFFLCQVMTVTWWERTRSTTPSRPYLPTCDQWVGWSPTCRWRSPPLTKSIFYPVFSSAYVPLKIILLFPNISFSSV